LSDDTFDPYDDSIPISARMGMQHLGAESPPQPFDPENRLMPELPAEPVSINKPRGKRGKKAAATGQNAPFQPVQQPEPEPPSKPGADRRELVSTGLEVVGLVAFSAGFFLLHIWLGLIVMGVCLVALGVATSDRFTETRD
jgi:hypothetical protein